MKLNVIKRKYQISLFFLHLISLVLSFSATGIFIAGISIFFGFLIYMRTKHILSMLLMLGLVISVVATFISYSDEDALNARVIDRVNMEFYQKSEYSTYAVYELLSEKPGFIWTGLGVGLPTYFLKEMPSYKSAYSRNTKLTLNTVRDPSGIALILMESGIIALLLLSYLVVFFVRTCRSSKDKLQSITAYFLLCVFFTGLVSYGPLSPLFAFFLGLFFAQQSSRRAYAIAR